MRELKLLDTDTFSMAMRGRGVDLGQRRIRITRFNGTQQESDLTVPPNANGFGRIHHFRRESSNPYNWPANPLPIDPAARALGLPRLDMIRAQVFQNAVCNWRCWYCFVPFELLSGSDSHSEWITADELINLYLQIEDQPPIIDLTGGQPDLTPEWIPWIMEALKVRDLAQKVYLWSDDNLSNDYFWRFLSEEHRQLVASYRNYGRVCCFKGFDAQSFSFNTRASGDLFSRQFDLFRRLLTTGIDLYAYATFTSPSVTGIADAMARFVDCLQEIHPNLPLRTVPLQIKVYTPVESRVEVEHDAAITNQHNAIEAWKRELDSRFTKSQRSTSITDVSISA